MSVALTVTGSSQEGLGQSLWAWVLTCRYAPLASEVFGGLRCGRAVASSLVAGCTCGYVRAEPTRRIA